MPTSIAFNDGSPATLTNGKPTPGDRFSNWNPDSMVIGDQEEALGTGVLNAFVFRHDFLATFELRQIPQSQMDIMLRLQLHLEGGGTITVNTGDAAAHSYTCCLVRGAKCAPRLSDSKSLEYTMTFQVRNLSGGSTNMLCIY